MMVQGESGDLPGSLHRQGASQVNKAGGGGVVLTTQEDMPLTQQGWGGRGEGGAEGQALPKWSTAFLSEADKPKP